jgi:hypothetical protein
MQKLTANSEYNTASRLRNCSISNRDVRISNIKDPRTLQPYPNQPETLNALTAMTVPELDALLRSMNVIPLGTSQDKQWQLRELLGLPV